jgi:hypothetical protein
MPRAVTGLLFSLMTAGISALGSARIPAAESRPALSGTPSPTVAPTPDDKIKMTYPRQLEMSRLAEENASLRKMTGLLEEKVKLLEDGNKNASK